MDASGPDEPAPEDQPPLLMLVTLSTRLTSPVPLLQQQCSPHWLSGASLRRWSASITTPQSLHWYS